MKINVFFLLVLSLFLCKFTQLTGIKPSNMKYPIKTHFDYRLYHSGLIEKHNNFEAEFVRDRSMDRGYNHVYLLTGYFADYGSPLIKVGMSRDPIARLYGIGDGLSNYISFGCPFPIFVDFAFETVWARDIEQYLLHIYGNSRVYNGNVSSGRSEWVMGEDIEDLKKTIISCYESILSKNKLDKQSRDYESEFHDYSNQFKVDTSGFADWFFERSAISDSMTRYNRRQSAKLAKLKLNSGDNG